MTDAPVPASCNPPAGYRRVDVPTGPYFAALGPIHWREAEDGTLTLGIRLTEAHSNILGIPHGGMLLTFADGALGVNLGRRHRREPGQAIVTASLTSDFLGTARIGDWLEAQVTVRKTGRQLSFGECLLVVGERPILRASAVFSLVQRPGGATASDG